MFHLEQAWLTSYIISIVIMSKKQAIQRLIIKYFNNKMT